MADNEKSTESTQRRRRYQSLPELAEYLRDLPHVVVTAINPSWNSDTEEDRWHFVLPIEDEMVVVKTNLHGFVPKNQLEKMASVLLKDHQRVEELRTQYPTIPTLSGCKFFSLPVLID